MAKDALKAAVLKEEGLTLLHVLIGLIIFSAMFIPFLQMEKLKEIREVRDEGIVRVSNINQELVEYAARVGTYPAPANPRLPVTDARHGDSVDTSTLPVAGTCAGEFVDGVLCTAGARVVDGAGFTPDVLIGALPLTELGLNLVDGIDPYGRKYTYMVSRNLVEGSRGNITPSDVSGSITIGGPGADFSNSYVGQQIFGNGGLATITNIVSGTSVAADVVEPFDDTSEIVAADWKFVGDQVLTNDDNGAIELLNAGGATHFAIDGSPGAVHFAVISHGENGDGAYLTTGQQLSCSADVNALENENCDGDFTILALEEPDLDGDGDPDSGNITDGLQIVLGRNYFDDMVRVSSTIFNANWAKTTNSALIMSAGSETSNVGVGFAVPSDGSPQATLHVRRGNLRADEAVETKTICNGSRNFCFDSQALTSENATADLKCPSTRGVKNVFGIDQGSSSTALTKGKVDVFCDQNTRLNEGILSNECVNGSTGFDSDGNLICRVY